MGLTVKAPCQHVLSVLNYFGMEIWISETVPKDKIILVAKYLLFRWNRYSGIAPHPFQILPYSALYSRL